MFSGFGVGVEVFGDGLTPGISTKGLARMELGAVVFEKDEAGGAVAVPPEGEGFAKNGALVGGFEDKLELAAGVEEIAMMHNPAVVLFLGVLARYRCMLGLLCESLLLGGSSYSKGRCHLPEIPTWLW